MRKIFLFMMISLDGYFEGPDHNLDWHNVDEEFNEFAAKQLEESGAILFGRKTYQLMESYWPTAQASDPNDQIVTREMNNLPKIVFSTTLEKVEERENWKNVRLIKENVFQEVARLKEESGKEIAVLGSNHLAVTLLEMGLLDELRIMVNPVAIGQGTALFQGIRDKLKLKLLSTREFKSGNVLLTFEPQ